MIRLLSDADIAVGRLAGITEILPNPELFVAMYVRKEAVCSALRSKAFNVRSMRC
ncbi:Fic/DOC family N-terminal domain-containing protein [Massilia mucilaginosa]|uniref:Fic/DOC family N-terminal domain-containing protein n=1 Tax=Massilia mucilaginosa TaxID=2609282 RepID=UPI0022771D6B|nr:Fic/DOC family N-terminal domain-containing protein [Massilia mucilaginosa]